MEESTNKSLEFPRDVAKEIVKYVECGVEKINKGFIFYVERWGHGQMSIEIIIHENIIYSNGSESSHLQTVHFILSEDDDFNLQEAIENLKKKQIRQFRYMSQ